MLSEPEGFNYVARNQRAIPILANAQTYGLYSNVLSEKYSLRGLFSPFNTVSNLYNSSLDEQLKRFSDNKSAMPNGKTGDFCFDIYFYYIKLTALFL